MPTATKPPRCSHRVPNLLIVTRPVYWLALLLVSLTGSTTATVSVGGEEIDYRFVDPAGYMQPWPVEKVDEPTPTKQPTSEIKPSPAKPQPTSQPRDCYQAPPLSVGSVSIALPAGKLPFNTAAACAAQTAPTGDARLVGDWDVTNYHWSATCMRHRPLYFEEINAERYGYTVSYTLQPVISAARFFATIPALPYKMAIQHPRDCIYTLGNYRPGSCAPRRWNRLPWQLTAGVVEVGFIAGMILLIP